MTNRLSSPFPNGLRYLLPGFSAKQAPGSRPRERARTENEYERTEKFHFKDCFGFYLFLMVSPSYGAMPNYYEAVSLGILKRIEKALSTALPENYYIVETHISPLGQAVNHQTYIRDCLINEKIGHGVSRGLIFAYEKNGLFDNQFRNDYFDEIEVSYEGFTVKVGLISEDKRLIEAICPVIKGVDFSGIDPSGL